MLDEYLLFGLIGLVYGMVLMFYVYGFFVVFVVGVVLWVIEWWWGGVMVVNMLEVLVGFGGVELGCELVKDLKLGFAYLVGVFFMFNE